MRLILVNLSVSSSVAVLGRQAELISQLIIILYLEQAQPRSDNKYHSAKLKVENRTLLEMIKIYGRGKGASNSSCLRCSFYPGGD